VCTEEKGGGAHMRSLRFKSGRAALSTSAKTVGASPGSGTCIMSKKTEGKDSCMIPTYVLLLGVKALRSTYS